MSAIAGVNAAITTITMGGDYSIVANFALEIWEIRDWYDLDAIRNNLGRRYILMNDLDSTTAGYLELASETANEGKGWEPIGTSDDQFIGSFDGQGHEIRDLFINRRDEGHVGLFGEVGQEGVTKDIGVVNVTVTGDCYVGGLVGHSDGTVSNSYSTGSVNGKEHVGGLVGHNGGIVNNSYSSGSVTGDSRVGGLVGWNQATLSNSYSNGSVTGSSQVGGLVGYNTTTVSNSFWDRVTSGMEESDGGTGRTTAEMKDTATFTDAAWDIIAVALGQTNDAYTWNIINRQTYPFLSWQFVS